jgi:hypothetical protein
MPLWLNTAPVKVVVERWQDSQAAVVVTWLADLPVARLPLWQEAQAVVIPA